MLRHFLQFKDLSRDELLYLFERATLIKSRFKQYQPYHPLADRTLAMIFEKSSTRRTFEQDIIERFAAHSRVPVINGLTNEYH
ncbi:MAG: ornithine carbamoyltransferase, partial [Proteobacteria bacterium]|nr:ornithine carbamoyltransferase [Pseudomonadota bacterium]